MNSYIITSLHTGVKNKVLQPGSWMSVLERYFIFSILLNSRVNSFLGPRLHLLNPLLYITGELWSKITSSLGPKNEIIAGRCRGGHLTFDKVRLSIGGRALGGVMAEKLGFESLAAPASSQCGAGQCAPPESSCSLPVSAKLWGVSNYFPWSPLAAALSHPFQFAQHRRPCQRELPTCYQNCEWR